MFFSLLSFSCSFFFLSLGDGGVGVYVLGGGGVCVCAFFGKTR